MLEEEWKSIEGLEGRYLISSFGRVWSLARNKERKLCKNINGYAYFGAEINQKRFNFYIHVEVCKAFNGPKPFPGAMVLHWDDNEDNNTPNNLRWGTATENEKDCIRNGGYKRSNLEVNNV